MSSVKARLLPKPRRRDRRGGQQAEVLRSVLGRPTAPSTRAPGEKRRAYVRMQARYDRRERPWWVAVVLLAALGIAGVLGARAASVSKHLVAYDEAPTDYAALVGIVEEACQERICRFGWGTTRDVPRALRSPMVRLRVRQVDHLASLGQTTIRGAYGADFSLHYEAPPTAGQAEARRRNRDWEATAAAEIGRAPRPVEDLGGGWTRTPGRW